MGKLLHHLVHHNVPAISPCKGNLIRERLDLTHSWFKHPGGHSGTERVVGRHSRWESRLSGQVVPRASTSDRCTRAPDGQEGGDLPGTRR